ncbi:MAG: 3-phosphoshikimate 1-carboxyvinyltransferase [Phycisphaeraceae bacterium]|nr:MAG: 3-phosphoshikimate 1-carboxyvinyltransferase [Phycisphaeraceae bacterium]
MSASSDTSWLEAPLHELPDPLPLEVVTPGVRCCIGVRPPGSKSLTNRALLLAALAEGESVLGHALTDADDARRMIEALSALGVSVEEPSPGRLLVLGVGGRFPRGGKLFLNNAGTATRFLTAAACLCAEPVVIDGNDRMRERPIGELLDLLRRLDIVIDELGEPGRVPVRVHPRRPAGGVLEVGPTLSSQYISALMMIAPWLRDGLTLRFTAPPTSPSYICMTAGLLRVVGATVETTGDPLEAVRIEPGDLPGRTPGAGGLAGFAYSVEPDASGATYLLGACALLPGATVRIVGLGARSLQGDAKFGGVLEDMGVPVRYEEDTITCAGPMRLEPVDADLSSMPDAAMTLASLAAFADGVTTIRGLKTLRVKETDRIAAMQTELGKVGVRVEVFADGDDESITITPPENGIDCSAEAPRVVFDTYDDHRMAMSLALIGLRRPNVLIADPGCVAKTYPSFWSDFAQLYRHTASAHEVSMDPASVAGEGPRREEA